MGRTDELEKEAERTAPPSRDFYLRDSSGIVLPMEAVWGSKSLRRGGSCAGGAIGQMPTTKGKPPRRYGSGQKTFSGDKSDR